MRERRRRWRRPEELCGGRRRLRRSDLRWRKAEKPRSSSSRRWRPHRRRWMRDACSSAPSSLLACRRPACTLLACRHRRFCAWRCRYAAGRTRRGREGGAPPRRCSAARPRDRAGAGRGEQHGGGAEGATSLRSREIERRVGGETEERPRGRRWGKKERKKRTRKKRGKKERKNKEK